MVASNRCHYHRCERTSECRPLVLAIDNDDDNDHDNDDNDDDKERSIFHATVKGLESADSLLREICPPCQYLPDQMKVNEGRQRSEDWRQVHTDVKSYPPSHSHSRQPCI